MSDEQDMRKMGGLIKLLPLTYTVIVVGSLALIGFPFLTGFYSKDVILELVYGSFSVEGRFVHTLGSFAAFFTAYYSMRLLAFTFLRPVNGLRTNYIQAHESPIAITLPLIILSFASLFIGYISRDMIIGFGTDFWGNALFTLPTKQYFIQAEWLDSVVKIIPLYFSFRGMFLAIYMYLNSFSFLFFFKQNYIGRIFYTFFNRKWFFDKVYTEWVSLPLIQIAYKHTYQIRDRGLLENFGPQGLSHEIYSRSMIFTKFTLGFVFRMFFIFLGGLILSINFVDSWNVYVYVGEASLIGCLRFFIIVSQSIHNGINK